MRRIYPLFICLIITARFTFAQSVNKSYATIEYFNEPISRVLLDLKNHNQDLKVSYNDSLMDNYLFSGKINLDSVEGSMRKFLQKTGFSFLEYDSVFYLIAATRLSNDIAEIVSLNRSSSEEQLNANVDYSSVREFQVSGTVKDAYNQSPIIGTAIEINGGEYFSITDDKGFYKLKLPYGKYKLVFSQLGYERGNIEVLLNKDSIIDIEMFDRSISLDEVVVSGNSFEESVNQVQSSVEVLNIKSIRSLPTFLGEVDIIKSITSLPGVTTVGEGASGFNVRGGSVDQNLILMDGIPIFNSSHLFGFFSVFNPDIVDSFTLYKGGIPSSYGGRASSILDVVTKEGSMKDYSLNASVGLISSKLKLEIPILMERMSLSVGGRMAYPTYLLRNFPNSQTKNSKANFYDVNSKLSFKINKSSKIKLSTYLSEDEFRIGQDTTYSWRNFGFSATYKKLLNKNSFISVQGIYSSYINSIEGLSTDKEFLFKSGINYKGLKAKLVRTLPKGLYEIGIQSDLYNLNVGDIKPNSQTSNVNQFETERDLGLESSVFFSLEKDFSSKFNIQFGTRISHFGIMGPKTIYEYSDKNLPSAGDIADTLFYGSGIYDSFIGVEPRANMRYLLNENSSIKFGYNLMRQNIHIISITSAVAPGDYWKLGDTNIPTTYANQINLGYYKNFKSISLTIDSYWKKLNNLLDYRDGSEVFLNPQIETAIIRTKGISYGAELKLEKRGKLSGWISYTLSRTIRKAQTKESSFKFPANFDKPHNLNITSKYALNKKFSLSSNFVFTSGRAITIPESGFYFSDNLFVNYSERNGSRIPNYHRLDLSLVYEGNLKRSGIKSRWAFSIYNVYSRRNPYSIYFDTIANNSIPQGYRLSILGQAFPSISYTLEIL